MENVTGLAVSAEFLSAQPKKRRRFIKGQLLYPRVWAVLGGNVELSEKITGMAISAMGDSEILDRVSGGDAGIVDLVEECIRELESDNWNGLKDFLDSPAPTPEKRIELQESCSCPDGSQCEVMESVVRKDSVRAVADKLLEVMNLKHLQKQSQARDVLKLVQIAVCMLCVMTLLFGTACPCKNTKTHFPMPLPHYLYYNYNEASSLDICGVGFNQSPNLVLEEKDRGTSKKFHIEAFKCFTYIRNPTVAYL